MYSNLVPAIRAEYHPTFTRIFKRLKDHGINLYDFIESELKVYESTLDGVAFKTHKKINPMKNKDFLSALRVATTEGKPVFREGKKFDCAHWAVDASMAATVGIGFREITYLNLEDLKPPTRDPSISLGMRTPKMNPTFSSKFGKTRGQLDISSLHCAVWGEVCSVHVDETGFVMEPIPGMSKDVIMTPDFLQHTLLELVWKDKLGMPDAVEIFVPNSANDFTSFGMRGTADLTDKIKLTVSASYNIRGTRGFSKTVTLEGKF